MNSIPHRLIYYAPDGDPVNLRHGTLTIDRPGTVTMRWGGLTLVTVCPNPVTEKPFRLGGAPCQTDALLFSHVRSTDTVPAGWCHVPVISVPGAVDNLERQGCAAIHPLSNWERIVLRKGDASVAITAIPARHRRDDQASSEVMDAMLELRSKPDEEPFRMYLSAGSLSIDELEDLPLRFPDIHVAVLYLNERAAGPAITTDETHAGQIVDITRARKLLFVPLGQESQCKAAMERLQARLDSLALGHLVSNPGIGGTCRFTLPQVRPLPVKTMPTRQPPIAAIAAQLTTGNHQRSPGPQARPQLYLASHARMDGSD